MALEWSSFRDNWRKTYWCDFTGWLDKANKIVEERDGVRSSDYDPVSRGMSAEQRQWLQQAKADRDRQL